MKLTITGYSTALFSTWFLIEELGILFDCGDGASSGLLQKSRKVKHAFISHADRDHLGGLVQFNQLNAREGFPIIHYPKDSGSFPFMKTFTQQFDPHVKGTIWNPVQSREIVSVKNDLEVEMIKNGHVQTPDNLEKSFSFKVYQTKTKLKKQFTDLSGKEIKALIDQHGKAYTSEVIKNNILGYSGDTPVEDLNRWQDCKVLIHEATFIDSDDIKVEAHGNKHSRLEEVIKMVSNSNIEQLILSHFSSRYSKEQIDHAINELCNKYELKIPVRRLLPGEIHRDILNTEIINKNYDT